MDSQQQLLESIFITVRRKKAKQRSSRKPILKLPQPNSFLNSFPYQQGVISQLLHPHTTDWNGLVLLYH